MPPSGRAGRSGTRSLQLCPVCRLAIDPSPDGFYTAGCWGCGPADPWVQEGRLRPWAEALFRLTLPFRLFFPFEGR